MSQDSTTAVATTEFRCLTRPPEQLIARIRENVGQGSLGTFSLPRLKVPSGGGTMWTVPSVRGDQSAKEIEGIIIHKADMRSYWADEFAGGNNPPDCASADGLEGRGEPGGMCGECALSQFGSASKGGGQACKEVRLLFVLRQTDLIPLLIAVPPTSMMNARHYALRLLNEEDLDVIDCITAIGLEPAQNATGIKYAKAIFRMVRPLSDDERHKIVQVAAVLKELFRGQGVTQADVSGHDG